MPPRLFPTQTRYVLLNTAINASELFTVTHPNDEPITRYSFWDQLSSATSGFFRLSGSPLANGQKHFASSAELSSMQFVAGSQIGSEEIRIQARDLFNWSQELTVRVFFVRPNVTPPTVSGRSVSVLESERVFLSDLITAADPDGWPITRIMVRDANGGDSGFFQSSDRRTDLPQVTAHYLTPAQFADTAYVGRRGGEQELIETFAYDGVQWSQRATFTISTIPNLNRPTAHFKTVNMPIQKESFIGDLFTFTDPDGNSAKIWEIWDNNTSPMSGSFALNNQVFPARTWFRVTEENMSALRYIGAQDAMTEDVRFRVWDGKYWSDVQSAAIVNLVRPKFDYLPISFNTDLTLIPFSQFITKVDTGPNFIWYEVIDRSVGFNTGKLALGLNITGILQENVVHRLTPQQFQNLYFRTGRLDTMFVDDISIRVSNGIFTSPWEKFRHFTIPNFPTFARNREDASAPWRNTNNHNDWLDRDPSRLVTYGFGGFTEHTSPDGATADNSFGFDVVQRTAVRQGFHMLAEFVNLRFEEVNPGVQSPVMNFHNYFNPPPDAGTGELLGYVAMPLNFDEPIGGDVLVNMAFHGNGPNYWLPGSNAPGWRAILSGISTGLGVSPAGVTVGGSRYYTGATPIIPSPPFYALTTATPHPLTLMLWDMYALQNLYGGNMQTRTGDDVYSVQTLLDGDLNGMALIWDAGGNDTISAVAPGLTRGAVIDLRETHFSSLGNGVDNVVIGFNVQIENAIGSQFNDTINGNHLNNVIRGGAGNDTLWGNAGDDLLFGGTGNDTYVFEPSDGFNVIDEERSGGRDRILIRQVPGGLTGFSTDFTFYRRFRDLFIDLTIGGGDSEVTIQIKDQRWGGSQVETLQFGNTQVDLRSVYALTTSTPQQFRLTSDFNVFGFIAAPL
jgi:Ca2+-binding RTX toxin-like protein